MQAPTLVILAAGMGSRYGGLKQIDPIDEYGNLIIDYSVYDALRAGFRRVVCIIKKEIEAQFRQGIGARLESAADVDYVFQSLRELPKGFSAPKGREKPWGTGHALLCCKDVLDGPFAVINADDYYGRGAFKSIYDYLYMPRPYTAQAMIGYEVQNTLTDNGSVTRGICDVDEKGYLSRISEIAGIKKSPEGGVYTKGGEQITIEKGTTVSMNLWGFSPLILDVLERGFPKFLEHALKADPLKGEYLLPELVHSAMRSDGMSVKVLKSADQWFGVTYKEDMGPARQMLRALKSKGVYPEALWASDVRG